MVTPVPIVVFAGQSNANNTGSIAAILARVAANGGVMVQAAQDGSPLAGTNRGADWSASGAAGTGELLQSLYSMLDGLLDPNSPTYLPGAYLDAVIWSQGGADVFNKSTAQAYQTNLNDLISTLQSRYGKHDFVISGLANSSLAGRGLTGQMAQNWHAVQDAQTNLDAQPKVLLLNPDKVASAAGISAAQMYNADYIHYKKPFGAALGAALVDMVLPNAGKVSSMAGRTGSSGNDAFSMTAQGVKQYFGAEGSDSATLAATKRGILLQDVGFTTTRLAGRDGVHNLLIDLISVETVTLSDGSDEARLNGTVTTITTLGGKDRVTGSAAFETANLGDGNDYAAMQGGNDTVQGGRGNDTILGGQGSDVINAGAGRDVITGGAGDDRLTGGADADQFIFAQGQGRDTITDFQRGLDDIVIQGAKWSDVTLTAQGAHTLVQVHDITILLQNIVPGQILASDFIFQ